MNGFRNGKKYRLKKADSFMFLELQFYCNNEICLDEGQSIEEVK